MSHSSSTDEGVWTQRDRDLSWREIDGEVIVLDLRSATYLRFNPVGTLLWLQLESGVTERDLERLVSEQFGLGGDQARRDVGAFLESCVEKELIEMRVP